MRADVMSVLMDGPPALQPTRVAADTLLRGRRVTIYDAARDVWVRDLRAADDPFWVDEETGLKWPARQVGETAYVAPLAVLQRAVLHVVVVTERDFYQWQVDHRRPEVREYEAHLVWVE